MNESCNIYECAMLHSTKAPEESRLPRHTYEWVMSHIWMSHVLHVYESCLTDEWVMSRIWMSHVTHMNNSCHAGRRRPRKLPRHTYEQFHAAHMKESCLTYGVATISRLLKFVSLFCKWALQKRLYSAKETYNFKEPTSRSHPIWKSLQCLFCRIPSLLQGSFAKETYNFKEPPSRSHPIWISRVSHVNESRYTYELRLPRHTYEWIMSHVWMLHVTQHEDVRIIEAATSHIWMSHVLHVNESCHTCGWVVSHIWMRHASHMNESCRTYEWVMSHIWMSHVTHMNWGCHVAYMNESCLTYGWVMSRIWMRHVIHTNQWYHTARRRPTS